jgi:hypothetical protein
MARKFVLVRGSNTIYFVTVCVFYYTKDPVKKNDTKFRSYTEELWKEVLSPRLGQCQSSMLFRQNRFCMSAVMGS